MLFNAYSTSRNDIARENQASLNFSKVISDFQTYPSEINFTFIWASNFNQHQDLKTYQNIKKHIVGREIIKINHLITKLNVDYVVVKYCKLTGITSPADGAHFDLERLQMA